MTPNDHRELNFLIKAFARYCGEADVIMKFRMQFGRDPTRYQLARADLGRFLNDRRSAFKDNHLTRRFRDEREKYERSKENMAIASQAWRMEQYQHIYQQCMRRAAETGAYSRPLDILTLAAKDSAGFYNPKTQNVSIDNRTVNVNMTDDEINKRLNRLLLQFGVNIPDMPLIKKGSNVIEIDDQSEEEL